MERYDTARAPLCCYVTNQSVRTCYVSAIVECRAYIQINKYKQTLAEIRIRLRTFGATLDRDSALRASEDLPLHDQ